MNHPSNFRNTVIDHTISQRTGVGPNEMVKGWQTMLNDLLDRLTPYLQPSRIVTFRHLTVEEQRIFQHIAEQIVVPDNAWGVYLSPSARNQMLYTNRGQSIPEEALVSSDDGVLLLRRISSHRTVINALLARPPHSPAIDVYHNGALMAGYVFDTIDDCLASLSGVIDDFLGRHDSNQGGAEVPDPNHGG